MRATPNNPARFRGKEACHLKPNEHSGEKNGETFTAFMMESQTWAGAMHDKMLEVLDTAEAKEGRVAEADIRNGPLYQDTADAISDGGQTIVPASHCVHEREDSKNDVCNPGRCGFKARKQNGQSIRSQGPVPTDPWSTRG